MDYKLHATKIALIIFSTYKSNDNNIQLYNVNIEGSNNESEIINSLYKNVIEHSYSFNNQDFRNKFIHQQAIEQVERYIKDEIKEIILPISLNFYGINMNIDHKSIADFFFKLSIDFVENSITAITYFLKILHESILYNDVEIRKCNIVFINSWFRKPIIFDNDIKIMKLENFKFRNKDLMQLSNLKRYGEDTFSLDLNCSYVIQSTINHTYEDLKFDNNDFLMSNMDNFSLICKKQEFCLWSIILANDVIADNNGNFTYFENIPSYITPFLYNVNNRKLSGELKCIDIKKTKDIYSKLLLMDWHKLEKVDRLAC